jgi:LCP family protein required for cell wall assembly
MPVGSIIVKNRPSPSTRGRFRKIALLFVLGTNILVWGVVALSVADRYGLPFGPRKVLPAGFTSWLTPVGSGSSRPTVTPARPLEDEWPTLALPTTTTIMPSGRADVSLLPIGDDTLVIALLGMDTARSSALWRTDSIILVFIQQQTRQIGLLSVPRDLWVHIPDHKYGRINTVDALGERAHPGGGQILLDRTFRQNLGVPIDHVIRIDFQGFVRIIDAVGGVTIDVEKPIVDRFPDPLSPTGEFQLDLQAGPQHLDGRTALAYCRSRMTTSDFDRSRRQRQVLIGLRKQAFTMQRLDQAAELWAALGDAFQTDLPMVEAAQLAHLAYGIGSENVRSTSIGSAMVEPWTTPQGAQVLLPQTDAIQQAILGLLSPLD